MARSGAREMTDLRRAAQGNSDEVNIFASFIAGRDIYTIIISS